jgi:hypothetical protein
MDVLIGVIITFLVVILVLYLVNMLPIDGRAKQIVRVAPVALQRCVRPSRPIATTPRHAALFTLV